jgi:hypothetical protein
MARGEIWTKNEDLLIHSLYQQEGGFDELCRRLKGRTPITIRVRASNIGAATKKVHNKWTQSELDMLEAFYTDTPFEQLCSVITRHTESAIRVMACKMGLSKRTA